ncbi:glycosyltransferase [Patescibacteria group bacterium]|nr:glycosyltransferase [Patescibacteria group bacterium]
MRILFLGGGTLGPVTPLIAVWEEMTHRDGADVHQTLFVGTRSGPERSVVAHAGIPFVAMTAAKLDRFFSLRLLAAPFVFVWSLGVALWICLRFRPDVMLSAGGYVAVPFAYIARFLHVPVVLHQMDLAPGLTNRLLAPHAAAITVAVPELIVSFSVPNVTVTGIPVRRAVADVLEHDISALAAAEHRFAITDRGYPVLLIMGGGTGALQINTWVAETLSVLLEHAVVIHVTGKGKAAAPIAHPRYIPVDLLSSHDLTLAYAVADFVVSRAGMGAIAELVATEIPFLLVPMPDSPQEENAHFFSRRANIPVLEKETTALQFRDAVLRYVRDPRSWPGSIERLRTTLPPNAAAHVVGIVREVVEKK